ncbi:hypothetical protein KZZ52_49935 [Dactylosporangium sp. AC04546]|uniref:hypothetical protein n=1 Tax=Dactylosporangium sp. AC04546 TaxID=2862460 RepID=UPI001EE01443|nr:hypothetical protein [Dactylosporangium sp. AC04546]WVK82006.1 hypothetical protein KZZ52_49935 [Dactylosporangium sp. AC04546]
MKVIEGKVVGHSYVHAPRPARKRRRWPWFVGGAAAALAACLALPVAIFFAPIVRDALAAGGGSSTPAVALEIFVGTFNQADATGERIAKRVLVGDRKSAVLDARRAFLDAQRRDMQTHPEWLWDPIRTASAPPDDEPESVITFNYDLATIVFYYGTGGRHATRLDGPSSFMILPWRAVATRERDGWYLTDASFPNWCGAVRADGTFTGYAKCE